MNYQNDCASPNISIRWVLLPFYNQIMYDRVGILPLNELTDVRDMAFCSNSRRSNFGLIFHLLLEGLRYISWKYILHQSDCPFSLSLRCILSDHFFRTHINSCICNTLNIKNEQYKSLELVRLMKLNFLSGSNYSGSFCQHYSVSRLWAPSWSYCTTSCKILGSIIFWHAMFEPVLHFICFLLVDEIIILIVVGPWN